MMSVDGAGRTRRGLRVGTPVYTKAPYIKKGLSGTECVCSLLENSERLPNVTSVGRAKSRLGFHLGQ